MITEKVFTVIYGSIHRSSSEREYKNPEPVYIPVPQEPQSLHTDLDKCSCIDVAVTTSKIKRNLGGFTGYKLWTQKVGPWGVASGSNLAEVSVDVRIKDIEGCEKWKEQGLPGVGAEITCDTRYGGKSKGVLVFIYMQDAGTQPWLKTTCSLTNVDWLAKPGQCKAVVEVDRKVCFSMSFEIS